MKEKIIEFIKYFVVGASALSITKLVTGQGSISYAANMTGVFFGIAIA